MFLLCKFWPEPSLWIVVKYFNLLAQTCSQNIYFRIMVWISVTERILCFMTGVFYRTKYLYLPRWMEIVTWQFWNYLKSTSKTNFEMQQLFALVTFCTLLAVQNIFFSLTYIDSSSTRGSSPFRKCALTHLYFDHGIVCDILFLHTFLSMG